MQRNLLWVSAAGLLGLAVMVSLLFINRPAVLHGSLITPPLPAADIQLTDHYGQPFRLSDQRGKVVLLYFGFINCPSECPATMGHIKLALEELGDAASRVQVIMVSTDPERDTPAGLQGFLGNFNPNFLGLTGSLEELQATWKAYNIVVEHGGETHSTYLFVIDPAGNIRETFQPDSPSTDIAADLRILLDGK